MLPKATSTVTMTYTSIWQTLSSVVAILLMTTLVSCDDPKDIGTEIFTQDVGVLYTDTLTVDASTLFVDSVALSARANLFVGSFTDPDLGRVDAKCFFQVSNSDTLSKLDTTGYNIYKSSFSMAMDSLVLILPISYVAGDTNQTHSFKVYRVKNSVTGISVSNTYLNDAALPDYESTPLGTVTLKSLRPIKNQYGSYAVGSNTKFDTLRIPLSKELAAEIYALRLNTNKSTTVVYDKFKDILKGLVLVSESGGKGAVVGFSGYYSAMRLYYHSSYRYPLSTTRDTTVTNKVSSFPFYVSNGTSSSGEQNVRYSNVTTTRSGALATLSKTTKKVSSSKTNGIVYLQQGTGLGIKLDFPTLSKLKEKNNVAFNKAELVFQPNALPAGQTLVNPLGLFESTPQNTLFRTSTGLVQPVGESSFAAYSKLSGEYVFNVTSSLQNLLSGRRPNNGWIIAASATSTSSTTGATGLASSTYLLANEISRASFNAKNIKLRVYYTYVAK